MATEQEALKIYLPADLVALVREEAERDDRSITAIVRRALRSYFTEQQSEKVPA